jgi:membrane protease YdiL (CAAX protease family)
MAERRGTVFLLLGMVGWIVAGMAGAILAAVIWAIAAGLSGAPQPSQLVFVLIATCGFQGTLLLVALWRGRRAGGGDLREGIGLGPIRRRGMIALLCLAMLGWLLAFLFLADVWPALSAFAKSVTPEVLSGLGGGGPFVQALKIGLVAVLAPVSEEFFFRGWLWEGLRRRGNGIATIVILTAVPWLLLHGIDSPGRILFLIPAAAIFSLARYLGRGVLASLAVHMTNNGTAVLLQALGELLGGHS